ncbi:sterol desaturase family protein [Paucibacter sp. APW11]|uniref:Sterol desaturase family protein n=1 Tax=Roseateles aquae TaxID=3077235 RepID=A0ABU3P6T2_9BURK|nr:sterol desaturase family protein [Paucibacter sp. APW11]MDT8998289.1 sterol desaturase family protein [Paucibacter sp. APW11]
MLVGGNGLALLWAGHASPATLGPGLAALLMLAGLLALGVERLIPYRADVPGRPGEAVRDLVHAMVNEGLSASCVLLAPLLTAQLSLTWHGRPVWPLHWPLPLQWLCAVLIADAGITLMHVASHRLPLLWRLHAVHHSVQRFYCLNGLLKHPLHLLLEASVGLLPLLLLGLPQSMAMLLSFSIGLQLLMQHSNADMQLGPWRRWLSLAPLHRFHHLPWAGIGDVNFGLFTTLWDRLLGTAYDDPSRRFGPGDFGIGTEPNYPQDYLGQLRQPFIAASRAAAPVKVAPSADTAAGSR